MSWTLRETYRDITIYSSEKRENCDRYKDKPWLHADVSGFACKFGYTIDKRINPIIAIELAHASVERSVEIMKLLIDAAYEEHASRTQV